MPAHAGVELGTELFRDDLTKLARGLAHQTMRQVPHLATVYEVLGPSIVTKGLSVAKAFLPEFNTKTPSGKAKDFLVDMLEAYILELPEAAKSGGVHAGTFVAPGGPTLIGTADVASKFLAEAVIPRIEEFAEFVHPLGPRARTALAQYILVRPDEDFQRFLSSTVGKRLAVLSLLVPRSLDADIERLETEIRVRWTYGERLVAEAARAHADAVRFRGRDRLAVEILMEEAREKEQEAQQLVAFLNELQADLLRLRAEQPKSLEERLPRTTKLLQEYANRMALPHELSVKKFGWFDRKLMRLGGLKVDKTGRRPDPSRRSGWFGRTSRGPGSQG